jgi:anti-sigma factor RsiW
MTVYGHPYDELRALLRHFAETAEVPPQLEARIAAALDREVARWRTRRRAAAAVALAAAAAILAVFLIWTREPDFPRAASADYAAVSSGDLQLQMRTADPASLQQWLDARLPFQTRVFDFAMMRYQLLGGSVDSLARRRSALFAYRGERGNLIVCQMFEGRTSELPPTAETRVHKGITFHIFQRDGRTVVFWQEGDIVCVLVGEGAPDDVIALAFAKAMRPSPSS